MAVEKVPKPAAHPSSNETLKLSTLLVTFDVLVTDKAGDVVTGLTKSDFTVTEDGRPQEVATCSTGGESNLPRRVILLLDRSGSQRAYMAASIEAAKELIDQLNSSDQAAIVTDDVELAAGYTSDKAALKSVLDGLKPEIRPWRRGALVSPLTNSRRGRSLQFTAIFAALRELVAGDQTRHIIIFQTDGDEAPTLRDQPEAGDFIWNMPERKYGLADIYRAAAHSAVTIYTIIPSEPLRGLAEPDLLDRGRHMLEEMERARFKTAEEYEEYASTHPLSAAKVKLFSERFQRGQEAAAHIAELSGGWAADLQDPHSARAIYSAILSDINRRYIIGYYPLNSSHDGGLRRVIMRVRNHPEYVVHGRSSYYAPSGN
ncbi:MAG TPA: VWA domain-containing protein [Blastocatellia bacterium]|nr:VWA domain-containing protein [Blastocatellia bacterium]